MTDQEIFEGIARKDNQTFLYLYKEYQGKILNMVQRNNGNAEDALDIFQEGVIALWTNIQNGKFQLKESARISTYLYALCRNIWISRLRKNKGVHAVDLDSAPQLGVEAEIHELEESYDEVRELEEQFRKLSEGCRKILKLFYYQKASMKEIASTLEITERTAKNNKYRCMQNLRAAYQV